MFHCVEYSGKVSVFHQRSVAYTFVWLPDATVRPACDAYFSTLLVKWSTRRSMPFSLANSLQLLGVHEILWAFILGYGAVAISTDEVLKRKWSD